MGASLNDHESWQAFGGSDSRFNSKQVADFSSKGPTSDGRLKPDVMAPGWWTSSGGSGSVQCNYNNLGANVCPVPLSGPYHCTLKFLRGTSMSTPTVAGHAVLIRQYFLEGYYPSGQPNPAHSFIPSGALLKAMLIHSAVAMENVISPAAGATSAKTSIAKITPVSNYPSNEQGYGSIQINNVLNFGVSTINPVNLFVMGSSSNKSASQYVALKIGSLSKSFSVYSSSRGDPIR